MPKLVKSEENYKKYHGLKLEYETSQPNKFTAEVNEKSFPVFKETLESIGIKVNLKNTILTLEMDPDRISKSKLRKAGRNDHPVYFQTNNFSVKRERVKYSDIILMQQKMTQTEIIREIGMTRATYYRHLNALKSSAFYESIDFDKLDDEIYLKSSIFDDDF